MKLLLLLAFSLCALNVLSQTNPVTSISVDSVARKPSKPVPFKTTDAAAGLLKTTDITDNLAREKNFSKFFSALQAAGLAETFKSKGPITIFVPDDAAFNKLSPGKLDSLLTPALRPQLIALISYHAIAGQYSSKDIARQIDSKTNSATFTTLTGDTLKVSIDTNRNLVLTDENGGQCTVTRLDIELNNGMLFIINGVLIPKKRVL